MLSKDDVDKMVRDAQEHAEEDRHRREEVETRNQAEALAFQAERTLRDLGDKVSSEDKAEVESGIAGLREALKGSDTAAVSSAATSLAEVLQRVSTAAYQAAGPAGAGGDGAEGPGGGPGGGPSAGSGEAAGEETIEGEYKEV
jgi:molecular chaperone DnaK